MDIRADALFTELYDKCKPFTMTSIERMYALYTSVLYLEHNNIDGDIVECGVWRGGSAMLCAYTLAQLGSFQRAIVLYDTFAGMSEPTDKDVDYRGVSGELKWREMLDEKETVNLWCYASIDEVRANMAQTGYPDNRIIYVKGKVEDTIPSERPTKISLLRLDTDWYESTYHELKYLFPSVAEKGIVIVDDYGYWQGQREAVDGYFRDMRLNPLMCRVDQSCRLMLKLSGGG